MPLFSLLRAKKHILPGGLRQASVALLLPAHLLLSLFALRNLLIFSTLKRACTEWARNVNQACSERARSPRRTCTERVWHALGE